ncbi:pyroglutamyl-peptidase I [Paenibacillus apiarius]|uniref:Pyrrolidone-carboxylate peptidase n=1 Tax=Paenibacillus apiarius TaxID=46240 RepID=A0ABT4DWH9_9BACL|nr:pyroglutamyl-peptidase I [Paenibacillus apiarius]MCY9516865.1 pyroglutamyl-peptidase I [Paenibacillus apiarius]MCY9521696.1 pyroglutamyl-peptidase I [Paenibacillus apiarius]MCY9554079.1 pyroglutamyl-peptidase I [Paenibacillus apiarius]MCY9558862.1 pyroglutamyl-peptidase I [Paenibacillus apiarius]MCY9683908.1 pyroglutamyl-peptidase I [Paenibacillus apiarius]
MSNNLLLTGFDPFGADSINPSWEAVRSLHGRTIGKYHVHAVQLPTSFARAGAALREAMGAYAPDTVLCIGQAGGRPDITLERVAINLMDARIADNDGAQPTDDEVIPGGPAAYWSLLPVKALRQALQAAGIPCSISYTAGTFVCNAIFYTLMHELHMDSNRTGKRGGFVHIPYLPEQAAVHSNAASMSLSSITHGLETIILHVDDVEQTGCSAGTLHGA